MPKGKVTKSASAKVTATTKAKITAKTAAHKDKVETPTQKAAQKAVIPKLVSKSKAAKAETEAAADSAKSTSKSRKMTQAQLQELRMTAKWAQLQSKMGTEKAPTYSMRNAYEGQTAIQHKTLGWGFILENKNDRLEVLFQDGIRYLISNYK